MSRQQRAAWVRQHLAALRQHLKLQLVKSELLVLPAGCAVAQESHVMLVQGSIQVCSEKLVLPLPAVCV
jgi:hypothetical protein